jgi:hypothetical protein
MSESIPDVRKSQIERPLAKAHLSTEYILYQYQYNMDIIIFFLKKAKIPPCEAIENAKLCKLHS